MTATVTYARFTITGEFITERARDLWEEGNGKKALELLADVNDLPKIDAIAICEGRMKLVGDSNTGCELVPDDYEGTTLEEMLSPKEAVSESLLPEPSYNIYDEEDEEEEDLPPPFFDRITNHTGWLTPDGKFYPCEYREHANTAYAAKLNQDDPALCRVCRFSIKGDDEPDQKFFLRDYTACTQVQREMITKYCAELNIPVPFYLRPDNDDEH